MTTLAIPAPQPNVGTITCAGLTRISSLLIGSMIWVKSTAAKLVAAPLAAQAGADLLARLAEIRGASRIGEHRHTEPDGSLFCRDEVRPQSSSEIDDAIRRGLGRG